METMQAADAWREALTKARESHSFSDSEMALTAEVCRPLVWADDVFVIAVSSNLFKDWVDDHARDVLTANLSAILNHPMRLVISVDESVAHDVPAPRTPSPAPTAPNSIANPAPVDAQPNMPASDAPANFHIVSDDAEVPSANPAPAYEQAPANPGRHSYYAAATEDQYFDSVETATKALSSGLNTSYNFETFVVGDSNRFANAAALAAAETPGETYNPLFMYSDSGLGKTHLMHAIGNCTLKLYPDMNVRYVTAEEFTNAFINAVRDERQREFKDEFRDVDVLLIDDIQFLAGKEQTIEEFFHTFNALKNTNKQIVISSDVAPTLLEGFEERLISRFGSGIVTDIGVPTLETRIAILERKAAAEGLKVPRDVSEYIAEHITTNVREMEGALRRVTAFAGINNQTADLALAEIALRDLITASNDVDVSATLIMTKTAEYFGVELSDFLSASRVRDLAFARQMAMYLCREMTDLSLPKIGELFGGRDHTTVMHACRKISKEIVERQETYNQVSELTSRIKQVAIA